MHVFKEAYELSPHARQVHMMQPTTERNKFTTSRPKVSNHEMRDTMRHEISHDEVRDEIEDTKEVRDITK